MKTWSMKTVSFFWFTRMERRAATEKITGQRPLYSLVIMNKGEAMDRDFSSHSQQIAASTLNGRLPLRACLSSKTDSHSTDIHIHRSTLLSFTVDYYSILVQISAQQWLSVNQQ
jgi:hypothetical protein